MSCQNANQILDCEQKISEAIIWPKIKFNLAFSFLSKVETSLVKMQIKFGLGNKKSPEAIYWPKIKLTFSSFNYDHNQSVPQRINLSFRNICSPIDYSSLFSKIDLSLPKWGLQMQMNNIYCIIKLAWIFQTCSFFAQ